MTSSAPLRDVHLFWNAAIILAIMTASTGAAFAGDGLAMAADIEVPTIVYDVASTEQIGAEDDAELDLANLVQSAARGVTTVQEAPAIVTVVTSEQIRRRGYHDFEQLLDGVPGWMRYGGYYSQFSFPLTRGIAQASLFMHDGLSLFDENFNASTLWRMQPLETIKRVEVITGPGGVLWGANSFLGVINVISKDAEDVDGIEAGVAGADGNGDRQSLRGYVMAGIPKLFGSDRAKLFLHGAFETYRGAGFESASVLFASPPPQPNSPAIYGPLTRAEPARSMLFNLDGKVTLGPLSLAFQFPFAERHLPLGFIGFVNRETWPEDSLEVEGMPGVLACPFEEPYLNTSDRCLDKGRKARDNQFNHFDRYAVAEYRTRFDKGDAGMVAKAYALESYKDWAQVGVLSSVPQLLEGGLSFRTYTPAYRAGGSIDGDVTIARPLRVLYGLESFHSWEPNEVTRARGGDGYEGSFPGPLQLERLPLPCPREPDPDSPGNARIMPGCPLTIGFVTSRTVFGAYLNPQWRATRKLTVDAGARLQVAPASLGSVAYDLTPSFSGALVYNFLPAWHLKLNYAQGFRPPVFNNTSSNGEAVQLGGDVNLKVETSDAAQAEINARLFRGERRLREVDFRADYSYTRLQNYIAVVAGRYENTADRGMHSAEMLASIYVQGGHQVDLGYTFLRMETADVGVMKATPEHWLNLTGIFNLVDDRLSFTTNLRVVGASEDPNRLIEYRDLGYDEAGGVIDIRNGMTSQLSSDPHEVVMDRLPPSADLSLGLTYTPSPRLRIAAFTYNTFNARYYQPDAFFSYEPRLEYVPNPYEDFSARVNVSYSY